MNGEQTYEAKKNNNMANKFYVSSIFFKKYFCVNTKQKFINMQIVVSSLLES